MQIDHDEIMRRAAAISPTLSAHARECDSARKLTAESMATVRRRRPVPDSAAAPRTRLRAESADARRRCDPPVRGVPVERLGADGHGRASLVHGLVSRSGAGRSLWRRTRRTGRGHAVVAGHGERRRGRLPRRRTMAILQRRRSCRLGNARMRRRRYARAAGSRGRAARRARSRRHLARDGLARAPAARTWSRTISSCRRIARSTRRILFRGASPHAANHATNLYRLSAEAMLSVSVATAVLGSAKFALRQFIERTKERRVILTGARKAEHGPTQVRLAEAAAEIHSADLLIHDILARIRSPGGDRRALRQRVIACARSGRPRMPSSYAAARSRGCSRARARTRCIRRAPCRPHFATSTSARNTPVSTLTIPPNSMRARGSA